MLLIITNIIQSHKIYHQKQNYISFSTIDNMACHAADTEASVSSLFTLTIVQWTINLHYCAFDNRKIDYAERCMSL